MLTVIPGDKFRIALAKQSTGQGQVLTTAEYEVPFETGLIGPMETREMFPALGAAYQKGQYKTKTWTEGDITFFGFPDSIGRLLVAHMGTDAITGAGDPWTHTITFDNTFDFLNLFVARPLANGTVEWDRYLDTVIRSLDINWAGGELLRVVAGVIGQESTVAISAPTITTTNLLSEAGPYYTFADTVELLDLDATPAVTSTHALQTVDVHMGYDSMELIQTDLLKPSFVDLKKWNVGLSGSFLMADWAMFKSTFYGSKTASNTAQSATVVKGSIDLTIQVGPAALSTRTLQIKMPAVDFSIESPQPNSDGAGLVASFTGALGDPGGSAPITCILKNAVNVAY